MTILLETGRADEAISYLERYPKGDLMASLLLGKVYNSQGDVAAARQVVEQAIAQNPPDGRPYVALATLSPTDSPEQLAVLQRGWQASPGEPMVGLFLASIYERGGKFDDAIAIYEAVISRDAGNLLIVNNLAALLLDHRQDKASLARALELAKALARSPDAFTLDTLGWAYYRNGDFGNAVRNLERAVSLDANTPLLQYHLGKAYAAAGNGVTAKQHLEQALAAGGPQAEFAADARATLAKLSL